MENQALVLAVAGVVLGAVLPFIAEYLNQLRGWSGDKATVAAVALSAVVSVGGLLLTKQLSLADLTLSNFGTFFPIIYGTTQLVYSMVAERLGWKKA